MFQRLGCLLLYPSQALRAAPESIVENQLSQSSWWRFAISGDLPILTAKIYSTEDRPLVVELLNARIYLQSMGLDFDLVIIDENAGTYFNDVREMLNELLSRMRSVPNVSGKAIVIPGIELQPLERKLIEATSTIFLDASDGPLTTQLTKATALEKAQIESLMQSNRSAKLRQKTPLLASPVPELLRDLAALTNTEPSIANRFDNGWGAFAPNAVSYDIDKTNTKPTPAPWSHVLANRTFGCVITESGGGYSWFGNSRQFKLTRWSNDPVCDPTAEDLWIRDEETFEVMHLLRSAETVSYTPGCASFRSMQSNITVQVDIWVDPNQPMKYIRLSFDNRTDSTQKFSLTYFADTVLGDHPERSRKTLYSKVIPEDSAVLVRNSYHEDYADVAMLLISSEKSSSVSGSRVAFDFQSFDEDLPKAFHFENLDGSDAYGCEAAASVRSFVTIERHSKVAMCFAVCAINDQFNIADAKSCLADPTSWDQAYEQNLHHWAKLTRSITVSTPNPAFDRLVNGWLMYQTIACRMFARTLSIRVEEPLDSEINCKTRWPLFIQMQP